MAFIPRLKKIVVNNKPQIKIERVMFKCLCCGDEKNQEKEFYKTNSIIIKHNNQRMVVCKYCVVDLYSYLVTKYGECKIALYYLCRLVDVYFDSTLFYSVEQQAKNSGSNIAKIYFQKINSLPQYSTKTFSDSTAFEGANSNIFESEINMEMNEEDKKNKTDVIRMVGYDPFENENPMDKKSLYNTLVDFLDDSTLEDSFKLPVVIEIVKSFNQIDKINQVLAIITADINSMQNQTGAIKTLLETKGKIYGSLLAMAKDNGISVNHSNNKSKGSGTLSGIIKQLQEKKFMEAEVNLFNIETCEGMRQVADISNQSILKQLQFDENDYVTMINEQRVLIQELSIKTIKLEEENRLLKIKIKDGDMVNG